MSSYVAFLRAVNVGGKNRVPMADLRGLALALGLGNPTTLLQSGNLFFNSDLDPDQICEALLNGIRDQFGVDSKVLLRSAEELALVISENPMGKEAEANPSRFIVMFLDTDLDPNRLEILRAQAKLG